MKTIEILQAEKFNEIYTNEELRNAVASAHGCNDKYGKHIHYKASMYPVEYIVTEEQIQEAKNEYERAKKEKVKNLKAGQFIFVGMGSSYSGDEEEIKNYRVRSDFKNTEGRLFFVEFSYIEKGRSFFCDFSIDRDLENLYNSRVDEVINKMKLHKRDSKEYHELIKERNKWMEQPYYNYGDLQKKRFSEPFTKTNILKIINETFGCSYTSIEVDNHTLRTEDFICFC